METQTVDLVGESVGHIRLIDVLGRGGMGTVYLGKDDTLQRQVAVKVIHGEHRLHPRAKARFLREARILSQISHRNICVVHDFIEKEDSDFLVLELVPGRSLRAAMRTQLPQKQKLDIARQVLEVLVAVHGAGVIHRDLKPENIMVKPDGEIAVLDFGLARSVDDDSAHHPEQPTLNLEELEARSESGATLPDSDRALSIPVRTKQGMVVGTAGYMSPEQARAEPATAASDMYCVGLIFQELFTGARPFDRNSGAAELVVKAAAGESTPVAGVAADLKGLIERLKSFVPGTRPSSVDALAELQRIIDRPKRQRRRAVVSAVWIALAVLAIGMTIQSVRASREAERANREAETARGVSDFLVHLFEESNPEQARGASLSAEEILKRGADRIDEELADQPLTRARLLMTIANVHYKMGLYDDALHHAEQAVEIRRRELGEQDGEVGEALSDLGYYRFLNGESGRADEDLQRALEILENAYGPNHIEVANTLMRLGILHRKSARFDEAETELQSALFIYENTLGPEDVRTARCVAGIAVTIAMQGQVEEAEPLFRRALVIQETELGEDHPSVAAARGNLAIALKSLGRYDEAEILYRQSWEHQRRVLGEEHPEVGKDMVNLANLYLVMERFDEAEPLYLGSLSIARAAFGTDHPEVALCLKNLGALYLAQGRWSEAEVRCLEALEIQERIYEYEHPALGTTLFNLGGIYRHQGRDDESDAMYRRSLAIFQAAYSPDHPRRTQVVDEYAEFLREQGRDTEAAELETRESGEGPPPE